MTDREPLRVGPLVLRWTTYESIGGGYYRCRLGVAEVTVTPWGFSRGDPTNVVSWKGSLGPDVAHATPALAALGIENTLRAHGFFASYRSRRRLLAEKAERRARGLESWVSGTAIKRVENKLQVDCFRALDIVRLDQSVRASKLRALAERLRNA